MAGRLKIPWERWGENRLLYNFVKIMNLDKKVSIWPLNGSLLQGYEYLIIY